MTATVELMRRAADLHRAGHFDSAESLYRQVLDIEPKNANALNLLGLLVQARGRLAEAVEFLTQAVAADDARPEIQENLAAVYLAAEKSAEAIACRRRALQMLPDCPVAHNALGVALEAAGDYQAALTCFREGVRRQPDYVDAHNNLGAALKELGDIDGAIRSVDEAIRLKSVDSAFDRGPVHGRTAQALDQRAVSGELSLAALRYNRAMMLLLSGDFDRGWPEYEWRLRLPGCSPPPWSQPPWDGSPLNGRTILLHPEQGLGDAFQFIRYAPLVNQRGGRVILLCSRNLDAVLSTCAGIDRLCHPDEALPPFDVYASLMSLPAIFSRESHPIPNDVPYLSAAAELIEHWRTELSDVGNLRVGIGWQGSPRYHGDRFRSIPLPVLAPLARVAGVRLISLQKGIDGRHLADVGFPIEDLGSRLDVARHSFRDTAAVIANLDLVITSDTALAHLAGALGARVWVALRAVPDWRWLMSGANSPWYPTMKLFRQSQPGNWSGVFEQMAGELSTLAQSTRSTHEDR
jgi:tetratricopeptide (TPR) repeat protein